GISVIDGDTPSIQNNSVSGNLDYGIGFDSSDGVATTSGATVQNNTSSNGNTTGSHRPDGFYITYLSSTTAKPVNITLNTANGNDGHGFYIAHCTAVNAGTFKVNQDNTANSNGKNGFEVNGCTGLTISNNTPVQSNTLNGYLFENSTGLTISNNTAGN